MVCDDFPNKPDFFRMTSLASEKRPSCPDADDLEQCEVHGGRERRRMGHSDDVHGSLGSDGTGAP